MHSTVDRFKEEKTDNLEFKPLLFPPSRFSPPSGLHLTQSLMQANNQSPKYDHFGLLKKLFPEQTDEVRRRDLLNVINFCF